MASEDPSDKLDLSPLISTTPERKNSQGNISRLETSLTGLLQPGALTIAVLGLCFIALVLCKILSPETKDATLLAAFVGLLIRSFFGMRA